MRSVLVTGGGGFIGQAIVRRLQAGGFRVAVLGRHPYPQLSAIGVECLVGDIRNREVVDRAASGRDTVFHVAAIAGIWGPEDLYESVNVVGTRNIIDACRQAGVSVLVNTSTPSVVFDRHSIEGGDEGLPYAERPLCAYARTKIEAERMVLAADSSEELRTAAIRPHLVWGPGDTNLIPRLIERGERGLLRIVGSGRNKVDISYIDNVVHAHLLAASNLHAGGSAGGQAFFIGQDEPVELWPWINALFRRLGIAEVTGQVPFRVAFMAGWLLESVYRLKKRTDEPRMTRFLAHQLADSHWFSHDRARRVLGYSQQVDTATGVDHLVSWLHRGDRDRSSHSSPAQSLFP